MYASFSTALTEMASGLTNAMLAVSLLACIAALMMRWVGDESWRDAMRLALTSLVVSLPIKLLLSSPPSLDLTQLASSATTVGIAVAGFGVALGVFVFVLVGFVNFIEFIKPPKLMSQEQLVHTMAAAKLPEPEPWSFDEAMAWHNAHYQEKKP